MDEQKLESYSFSKLKLFKTCPYAYYENYYNKKYPRESHGTSEFGSFVHNILEKYGRGELEIYELLPYYIEHFDENVFSDFTLRMSEDFSRDFSMKYFSKGKEFFENFNGFDFEIIDVEKCFELPYKDKFLINGKIDVVAADADGNLIVVDYKSKGNWKNNAEKKEYEKQLYLYAYAIKHLYGKYPKKMAFFMFRIDKWEWFDFKLKEMNGVLRWVDSIVAEIENEIDFLPHEDIANGRWDFFCHNFCSIRSNCKYIGGDTQ